MNCNPFEKTLELFKRYENEVTEYFKTKAIERDPEKLAAKRLALTISFSEIMLSIEQLIKSGTSIAKILDNKELKGHEVSIVGIIDRCVELAHLVLDSIETDNFRTRDTIKYKCLEIMDKLGRFVGRL